MEGPFCPPAAENISPAAPTMGAHSEGVCVQKQGEGVRAEALVMEQAGLLGVGKSTLSSLGTAASCYVECESKRDESSLIYLFRFSGLHF